MYTLDNIKESKSYEALNRKGFTDAQVVEYYNMETVAERTNFFKSMTTIAIAPKKVIVVPSYSAPQPKKPSTHLCTLDNIGAMAFEYMRKDFKYRGKIYNMRDYDWTFEWSTKRNAFGTCARRRRRRFVNGFFTSEIYNKRIQLSKWLVANSESTFEEWIDTMLHEIAHAIDVEIRGMSDHSYIWKDIASSVGAEPTRTTDVKISHKNTKYTMTCISCGDKTASHKRKQSHRSSACIPCCTTHNNGVFSRDYILIQTQNY